MITVVRHGSRFKVKEGFIEFYRLAWSFQNQGSYLMIFRELRKDYGFILRRNITKKGVEKQLRFLAEKKFSHFSEIATEFVSPSFKMIKIGLVNKKAKCQKPCTRKRCNRFRLKEGTGVYWTDLRPYLESHYAVSSQVQSEK